MGGGGDISFSLKKTFLVLADTLPFSEKTSSGTSVLIQGVECGFVNVRLFKLS